MPARFSTRHARPATAATGIPARMPRSIAIFAAASKSPAFAPARTNPRRRGSNRMWPLRIGSRQIVRAVTIIVALALMTAAVDRASAQQTGQPPPARRPPLVDDVFKNVQALKGIAVDDFMLTMGIMSAAVGSDCVGCHPSAGTDHVDWALDTPRKRTARRMVQMVAALNRDNFNGRQVVTCWTCHRGRDRPVTTMTLDAVYGPPTDESDDVLAQAQGVPSVDQVLAKYLQAIGGAQNVARITSFAATG